MEAPAIHAGFLFENSSVARPAAASPRCTLIRRLMYAASAAPRDSSMSARIWSSSRPICSTSSSVRWVYSLTSEMAMALLRWWWSVGVDQMSSVQSPIAAVTQVWICSLGWVYSSPLRRSLTAPLTRVSVQVWQMPMRQP